MIRRRQTSRFCCLHPLEHCFFRGFSLKFGVTLWAVVDIVLGLAAIATLLHAMPHELQWRKPLVELCILVAATPFAVLGLVGARNSHRAKVEVYSVYKRLELAAIVCLSVWQGSQEIGKAWEAVLSVVFFSCLRVIFDFYGAYVVWSSAVKLRTSGTLEVESRGKPSAELTEVACDVLLA